MIILLNFHLIKVKKSGLQLTFLRQKSFLLFFQELWNYFFELKNNDLMVRTLLWAQETKLVCFLGFNAIQQQRRLQQRQWRQRHHKIVLKNHLTLVF